LVEVIEYVLVFAISAGVAGASVMLVEGALPGLGQVAALSVSDQVAGAARLAAVQGINATLVMPLQDTTVACSGGTLTVSQGSSSSQYMVGLPCSFDYQSLNGTCDLVFSAPLDSLGLQVTC